MDLEKWKDMNEPIKWAMNADLVERWPKGDFRDQLKTVDDVFRFFPGVIFIDSIEYASDRGDGLFGALIFEFEPDGSVREMRAGYID